MAPTTPPLDFKHSKGFEIRTKHKETIRQLYFFERYQCTRCRSATTSVRAQLGRFLATQLQNKTVQTKQALPSPSRMRKLMRSSYIVPGESHFAVAKATRRAPPQMLYPNPRPPDPRSWLLALRSLPEAFLESCTSHYAIPWELQ